ncbi:slipin family protein [Methylomicrobium lacus]|uniref:slipin family protein n=1 Tax=Methylomicrobium lacus TaxID=136992 RepID=UPI00045E5B88|nr:slipin family protein [Methylomicrobium lacus]
MSINKKMIITEAQRGLLFKDQQFVKVLSPGVYRLWDWLNRYQLQIVTITNALQQTVGGDLLNLAQLHAQTFAPHLQLWETTDNEVGLVYQNNVLKDIKAPGQQGAYWKTQNEIRIDKLDISRELALPKPLAAQLCNAKEDMLKRAALNAIAIFNIPDHHVGFLAVDNEIQAVLSARVHAWWRFNHNPTLTLFDLRLQNMEVNGQEILTKDKVSLRVNLSATWQIREAEKARAELADAKEYLYRELQLALRTVVSTQTLDELLADKNSLNRQILEIVATKALVYGIEVKSVGARDIVLPGDMKAILTQVVEAQKMAEANLIKRQEETQATRSLHNTAKVMEGNPILLRLKELESLEKITARINTLNVYGGLDSVMNGMVKLIDKTNPV